MNTDSIRHTLKSRKEKFLKNFFAQPKLNPLVHEVNLSPKQKVQYVLMTITLFPIKLFAFVLVLGVTWFLAYIFTLNMNVPFENPVNSFRYKCFYVIRKMGRLFLFCLGFFKIEVVGKRALCKEAPILVCAPHSSPMDVFVMFVSDPLPAAVSRMENFNSLLIGNICKTLQPVLVARGERNSRRKAVFDIRQRAGTAGKWPQIVIFPEGLCTNRKALITFKPGAFIPGSSIQPVLIEYGNKFNAFWTMVGPSLPKVFWLSMCQFSIQAKVTYMPVYHPSSEEKADARLYADNVRALMADFLGIMCTDHSYEDCILMEKAASLNMPMETGAVEFTKLNSKFNVDVNFFLDKLEEFSKIAKVKSGNLVFLEDFANFLRVPVTAALQDLFDMYDQDDSGFVDYRKYIIGLLLVSKPAATDETIKLAFKAFSNNQNPKNKLIPVLPVDFQNDANENRMFEKIHNSTPAMTYKEFATLLEQRPEYAKLFLLNMEKMK